MTPAERSLRARIAAFHRSSTSDAMAMTDSARRKFGNSFVDAIRVEFPEIKDEVEIQRRAAARRREHYLRLALVRWHGGPKGGSGGSSRP